MIIQGLGVKAAIPASPSQAPAAELQGTTTNDLQYWDQTDLKWKILAAPATSGTFVLGVKDGTLQWLETAGCT